MRSKFVLQSCRFDIKSIELKVIALELQDILLFFFIMFANVFFAYNLQWIFVVN